jgi:hypothetical protein
VAANSHLSQSWSGLQLGSVIGLKLCVMLCLHVYFVASPVLRAFASLSVTWVQDCTEGTGSCHQPIASKSLGREHGSQHHSDASGPVMEQAALDV